VKGKAIPLLILIALVALVPAAVSAGGAEIYKGIYPANGFLAMPLDCNVPGGHILYFWFHEGDPPFSEEADFLLEGIAIRAPEKAKAFDQKPDDEPDILSFKAEGVLASVWPVEDLASFCYADGTFDVPGFATFFRSDEGAYLWDVAEQDTVSVKWNFIWTNTLYKDSLVATGKKLTYRSLFWLHAKDGVITDMQDITKLIWH
jgi:hypothetical protein